MSGVLFIGETEQKAIEEAVRKAQTKPLPWSVMKDIAIDDSARPTLTLKLDERGPEDRIAEIRREYPPQLVQLGSYTVAISFEEQPAGMMRHVSVSSRDPGKVPNEHVMRMVAEAFGFSAFPPIRPYRVWVEEYEPGRHAINLAELEPQ